MITQRQGVLTKLLWIDETTPGSDPTTPNAYVLPLASQGEYGIDENRIEVPVFSGDMLPSRDIGGNKTLQNSYQLNLEFKTLARLFARAFGLGGYTFISQASLGLHRYRIPISATNAAPKTGQLEWRSSEATAQILRNRGIYVGSLGFPYSGGEGAAVYSAAFVGIGDQQVGSIAGTVEVDEASDEVGQSYFNGTATLKVAPGIAPDGVKTEGMTDFNVDMNFNRQRQDTAFNAGLAAAINSGRYMTNGRLALALAVGGTKPESDLTFYNYAKDASEVWLECIWANKPIDQGPTKWLRIRQLVRFTRGKLQAGGDAGIVLTQDYRLIRSTNAKYAAEKWGNVGPFNVGASSFNIGIKINGGATTTIALTQGAARAVDEVVTDINANGTFAAVGKADNFLGRLRLTTKTEGTGGSVQIDTTVINSAHTALGFDGTTAAGLNSVPLLVEVVNDITSAII